jgi:hypothetical protein
MLQAVKFAERGLQRQTALLLLKFPNAQQAAQCV